MSSGSKTKERRALVRGALVRLSKTLRRAPTNEELVRDLARSGHVYTTSGVRRICNGLLRGRSSAIENEKVVVQQGSAVGRLLESAPVPASLETTDKASWMKQALRALAVRAGIDLLTRELGLLDEENERVLTNGV